MERAHTDREPGVATIGAGYWGKNLVRNFHSLGVLRIVCDSDSAALDKFKEQYQDIGVSSSPDEVLASDDVDAVAIATPAETHYALVEKSLLAGKHVFVEKPLCLDVDDGEKLVNLAKEKKLTLMIGHLLHYHPAVKVLKRLVNEGALGRLQYIYSNRLNLGKIRTEENILWSFAPHDISVLLSLAGQMPDSVSSFGSHFLNKHIADVTVSNLTFPSGVAAHIFVSWLHPFKEQKLVVVGDKKMVVFDDVEPEDKLLVYPHTVHWRNGVPVPDKKEAEKISFEKAEPLREECRQFIESVKTGVSPYTDGREGLNVLRILSACQKSMENGGKVIEFGPSKRERERPGVQTHETAVIDEGCEIGERTKIWHFSHVLRGSKIGSGCNIGQNVVIGPNARVGNGCKIQNNVSVYEGVTLEDDVFCGPSMVFTNVINPRSHIARKHEYKPTVVRKGATIGANATILCGIELGRYCFIGAGAVVLRDVPDYALVVGNPAAQKGWICECGAKLDFQGETAVCECGLRYDAADGRISRVGESG